MTTNKPKIFAACDLSTGRSEGEAMTDRELLELAAKAAGIDIFDWTPGGHPTTNGSWDGIWNPLTNDGDALRLAVRLRMCIDIRSEHTEVTPPSGCCPESEEHENDPCAATRHAIVRAAAEIGRLMIKENKQ